MQSSVILSVELLINVILGVVRLSFIGVSVEASTAVASFVSVYLFLTGQTLIKLGSVIKKHFRAIS